jgi:cytochrome c-type biogenesis protein CcmH
MSFLLAAGICVLATMAPLFWGLISQGKLRGRRESALALHRAQLTELGRERDAARLPSDEFQAATLEIERRLLVSAAGTDQAIARGGASTVLLLAALIPVLAFGLYRIGGRPDLIGQVAPPIVDQAAAQNAEAAREAALIAQLQTTLKAMDDSNPRALEGYKLLGRSELMRGNYPGSAEAYRHALKIAFDPAIAAMAGEIISRAEGHVTPEVIAMWQRSYQESPKDAPWRAMVAKRLTEQNALPAEPAASK